MRVLDGDGQHWTPGATLTGNGGVGAGAFGHSTSVSADGATAVIGAPESDSEHGGAWIFGRMGEESGARGRIAPDGTHYPGARARVISLAGAAAQQSPRFNLAFYEVTATVIPRAVPRRDLPGPVGVAIASVETAVSVELFSRVIRRSVAGPMGTH